MTTRGSETGRRGAVDHRNDLDWLPDELENLLYLVTRAGMAATARDLGFALRSARVELRPRGGAEGDVSGPGLPISRDDGA